MAFRSLATLTIVPLFALTAVAQDPPVQPDSAKPKNVLSTQPLSIIFTVYNAEFERALNPTMTLGATASYWSPDFDGGSDSDDDFQYVSADLKFRYYPSARPFEGFSFGMSVGVSRVREDDFFTGQSVRETVPSIGTYLDHGWLLGPTNRFYVGLGLGAKKLLLDDDKFSTTDILDQYPTARVSVGFAF